MTTMALTKRTSIFSKDFTLVLIGQIISLFGNAILRYALPLYILQQFNSPALFGQVSGLAFLPMIVMAPIGGIVADRVNKQRIMVVLDFITSFLVFMYLLASGIVSSVALVVVLLMALYAIQGAYTPAVNASIPLLMQSEAQLVPANAAVNLVTSLSQMAGPAIGGILFGTFGLVSILITGGICFFLSAVMELFITIPHTRQKAQERMLTVVKNDMKDSMRYIFKTKPIMAKGIVILFLFEMIGGCALLVGLPVLINNILLLNEQMLGYMQAIMMAGGLAGGFITGLLAKKMSAQKIHLYLLGCAVSFLPMSLVLFLNVNVLAKYWVIAGMCFIVMVFAMFMRVQLFAFIQTVVPTELVGKVFSCLMALTVCAQPIGQALMGWLFEVFLDIPWVIFAGIAVVCIIIAIYSRRSFKYLTLE